MKRERIQFLVTVLLLDCTTTAERRRNVALARQNLREVSSGYSGYPTKVTLVTHPQAVVLHRLRQGRG